MKFAMFQTPFMRPSRDPRQVFDYAVTQAEECDRAGFSEYWIGEHATMTYESIPNPELVIAGAARTTSTIKLCPGAHLLPYHHPASLAVQVSWLTHVTEGRYILGVGAGAYPSDATLRGFDDLSQNHLMVPEALEIMHKVWQGKPFRYKGKYWNAGFPEPSHGHEWRDVRPHGGKVEIAMAGLSPNSPSMKFAGTHGYLPLSVYAGEAAVSNHWETYATAATQAGHPADRSTLHVCRDVLVADTDAEARKLALEGGMGEAWRNYLMPVYKQFGLIQAMLPNFDPADVDENTLVEHVWLVGSPDTVAEKIAASHERTGGWGTTMVYGHDYIDNPEPWNESLQRLVAEVTPKIDKLLNN